MVQKFSKWGVYSGNTLRRSECLHKRRYTKQACVVRRSTTQKGHVSEILSTILGVNSDNVVFSLNKKNRWTISTLIRKEIFSDYSRECSSKFVLYEKHKLNKEANCIGFYCNKGKRKKMVSKPGRYFTEKSILNSDRSSKKSKRKNWRSANAVDAAVPETEEEKPVSEVRYDIFYPASFTSSSVIKEDIAKSRHHRGKKTKLRFKSVKDYVLDYELDREEDRYVLDTDYKQDSKSWEQNTCYHGLKPISFSQITASPFSKKTKSKYGRKLKSKTDLSSEFDVKPRKLIYTNDTGGFEYPQDANAASEFTLPSQIQSPLSVPVIISLPKAEIEPSNLKEDYGDNYYEAATIPRKFIIDISERVKELVQKCPLFKNIRCMHSSFDFSSYLVFAKTDLCNNETQTFRVMLNARLNANTIKINTIVDGCLTSVTDVIEKTLAFYETVTADTFVPRTSISNCQFASPLLTFELVKIANKWYAEGNFPDRFKLTSEFSESHEEIIHRKEETIFCDICFEEIRLGTNNSKAFTSLYTCNHWFCDECWRTHLLYNINSCQVKIRCPEYKCDSVIQVTTMMCFVNIHDISLLFQRCLNNSIQMSPNTKWCPSPDCGRILTTSADSRDAKTTPTSMACGCGTTICFVCMQPAHWPASCSDLKSYKDKIIKRGDYIHFEDGDDLFVTGNLPFVKVKGKRCPNCSYFIEKTGGCPYMICPCGFHFCWMCLLKLPDDKHNSIDCNKNSRIHNKVFLLDEAEREELFLRSKSHLYELAVSRRVLRQPSAINKMRSASRDFAKSLNRIASRNIVAKMLMKEQSYSQNIQTNLLLRLFYYFRKMIGIKLEVDHVIEFTAVYLSNRQNESKTILIIMSRLEEISSDFKAILETGKNQDAEHAFFRLFELEKNARKDISSLSKIVNQKQDAVKC